MKLCKDCKHHVAGECNSPRNGKIHTDPVDGRTVRTPVFRLCVDHRTDGWLTMRMLHTCGKSARWFEPK